ncbi:hypothetical protein KGM_203903 [Danaus plexippus plexippus]|uniref:Uncharacterized protein n=1 Tax=Danaus plexippus plexippus TaxID=278856 RepID=A0A212F9S7_DANPL|nr:hypothetical protein KGM_203903 [Danaus plexippus plexippus]
MDISCKICKHASGDDFKQIAHLKTSGLVIYVYYVDSKQQKAYDEYSLNNIILHNTSNKNLKRLDYIMELCQYRTKCFKCKMLIQRIRNAIDETSIINKNEVMGVCDYCKRSNQKHQCQRCQYIIEKFLQNKVAERTNREEQLRLWISKIQSSFISLFGENVICKHNNYLENVSKTKFSKLLSLMNSPSSMRQPKIEEFPQLFGLSEAGLDVNERKKVIEDLVTKFKNSFDNNPELDLSTSSSSESECICKYFGKSKTDEDLDKLSVISAPKEKASLNILPAVKEKETKSKITTATDENQKQNDNKTTKSMKSTKHSTDTKSQLKERPSKTNKKVEPADTQDQEEKKQRKTQRKDSITPVSKKKRNSEYLQMLELLKEKERERNKNMNLLKKEKVPTLPEIKDLPVLNKKAVVKDENVDSQYSESILECKDNRSVTGNKVIRGNKIIHCDPHVRHTEETLQLPMLYNVKIDLTTPKYIKESSLSTAYEDKNKKQMIVEDGIGSGVIRYELSNREFIDKGWTKLPTNKVMRRMNIYKMLPASMSADWFKLFKNSKSLFYDTGEKLAEIYDTGSGRWFYKDGNVALDVQKEKGAEMVRRYIVYSSVEAANVCKNEPITILACFDYLGNGVIYDHKGNVRLKYNQSEGLVLDKNIAPLGRWKWHSLNDPPVLQRVFINTYDKFDNTEYIEDDSVGALKPLNEDMIAIELDNFLKEKAHKLLQEFKPFQIRMKIMKLNNFFSLRIIDQTNIFLLFRCDRAFLRINIGMLLKNDEIIDTDIAEVSDVSTPYCNNRPKSPSLINIQKTLNNVRSYYSSSKRRK